LSEDNKLLRYICRTCCWCWRCCWCLRR